MSVITPSIADFLGSGLRVWSTSHVASDLVAGIPPEMLVQLRREGLRRLIETPFYFGGCMVIGDVVWVYFDATSRAVSLGSLVSHLIAGVLLTLFFSRRLLRSAVDRELRYRGNHGKWRWER